jgi:hypothetical protein
MASITRDDIDADLVNAIKDLIVSFCNRRLRRLSVTNPAQHHLVENAERACASYFTLDTKLHNLAAMPKHPNLEGMEARITSLGWRIMHGLRGPGTIGQHEEPTVRTLVEAPCAFELYRNVGSKTARAARALCRLCGYVLEK